MKLPYSINIFQGSIFLLVLSVFMSSGNLNAQISPGKLSKAHANLEGIKNCTACHTLGSKISEQKCLDCHKPLKARITQKKGYHVSSEIKGKSCITCHSDHHGLNFDMIRFDEKKFNHTLTGYELKGAHKKVNDCAKCHFEDHIVDKSIKLNKNTFLGLDPSCVSCHEDYHQKTLSNDCVKCHNMDAFKPASLFNHNKTEFPLKGAHTNIDCAKCHMFEFKNGKKIQQFADILFKNCNSCHKDPHHGEFGMNCKSCHNESSFTDIKTSSDFNHALTGFKLEGKHSTLDCKKCHDDRKGTKGNYKEFETLNQITCMDCHNDVHENKFGTNCRDCHSVQSFNINKKLTAFDHTLTGYALQGKHRDVDCRKCHNTPKMTDPLPHDLCASCHKDYHEGEFKDIKNRDCSACHTDTGFMESTFSFEQHEETNFLLEGAHLATACNACHFKNEKWKFKTIGKICVDCHNNVHQGAISEKFIPENDCKKCHNNDSWQSVSFDHNLTGFGLEGKHLTIECRSCHYKTDKLENNRVQKFMGLSMECASCHENIHGNQFEEAGVTDCKKCHGFNKWDSSNFNHNNAAFKLDGAHINVACNKCHQEAWVNGKKNVTYKTGKLECVDCHQ